MQYFHIVVNLAFLLCCVVLLTNRTGLYVRD